jgi:hypothetical protein
VAGLWNGLDEDSSAGLQISCGKSYSGVVGFIPNTVTLELPSGGLTNGNPPSRESIECILRIIAETWDPDWAEASSLEMFSERLPRTLPTCGWVTYLSSRLGYPPKLEFPSFVKELQGCGTLLITIDESFSTKRDEHLLQADRVRERLAASGLIDKMGSL